MYIYVRFLLMRGWKLCHVGVFCKRERERGGGRESFFLVGKKKTRVCLLKYRLGGKEVIVLFPRVIDRDSVKSLSE